MNVEERARLAVAMLPKAGSRLRIEWLYSVGLVAFVGGALYVIRHEADLDGRLVALILALLPLGGALLVFTFGLLGQLQAHRLAVEWFMKGDLERSSKSFFALLERRWAFDAWRASYATSLATCALMAEEPERAIVLFRAIATSGALSPALRPMLDDRTALALFALGQTSAARAAIAEAPAPKRSWIRFGVERAHVRLVVEGLVGPLEAAVREAEKAEEAYAIPVLGKDFAKVQRAFGWLLVAYVFERVARSKPAEDRLDAERRRDRAISQGVAVPPTFFRYLGKAAPDFVAFAERFATK
jgi:hypothetical protein